MSSEPVGPVRPSVPPLAWFAAGLWAGVWCAEALSWATANGLAVPGAWLAPVVGSALATAVTARRRRFAIAFVCLGILAGAISGGLCWRAWRVDVGTLDETRGPFTLRTWTDASPGPFGSRVTGVVVDGHGRTLRLEALLPDDLLPPELGQKQRVYGVVRACPPGARGRLSHRRGVAGRLSVTRADRIHWAPGLMGWVGRGRLWCVRRVSGVPGEAGALVAGVTMGDRRRLNGSAAEADFRTSGLSHLVAVSGTHLVVVAVLVAWVLGRLSFGRTAASATVLAAMAGYVAATGLQASAVRAFIMTFCVVGAESFWRRGDRLAALAAAVVSALAIWPPIAFDLGFQLSVAAVAGLVALAPLARAWLASALPGRAGPLAEPLALTLVAQVATLPITAPVFGMVSLVAPLANLLVAPLISCVLVTGLAGLVTSALSEPAGRIVLGISAVCASLAVRIAAALASLPAAAVPAGGALGVAAIVLACGCAVLWALWPRPSRHAARLAVATALLGLCVIAAGPAPSGGPEVVVLDVGQGDAMLVRDGRGAMLVDTGPSPWALRKALARRGVRSLDAVALTHDHEDHTGGAGALRGVVQVDAVVVPAGGSGSFTEPVEALEAPVRTVVAGERLTCGATSVRVLWPKTPVADAAENDASLVLLLERGATRVLLTGDAEGEVLDRLAADGALPDIDVLKVGHHGSAGSVTPRALAALKPEMAVISVGSGNRFGHPSAETLAALGRAGCAVRRTDLDGDVVIGLR